MKLKSLLMFALLLQGTAMANATIVQKLFLKNGSELEGYISVQRPGEDFTFTTERAVIYLLKSDLTANIIDNEVNVKQLSQEWIKWAEENEAFDPVRRNIPRMQDKEIVCQCEQISGGQILEAIRRGATTVDGIKRRVGTGMGRCQGSRCDWRIAKILKETGVNPEPLF